MSSERNARATVRLAGAPIRGSFFALRLRLFDSLIGAQDLPLYRLAREAAIAARQQIEVPVPSQQFAVDRGDGVDPEA